MWRQFAFQISVEQELGLSELLEELGAQSISLQPAHEQPELFEPMPGHHPMWSRLVLLALFDPALKPAQILESVAARLGDNVARECRVSRLDDRDWESAWRENVEPLNFNDRLWLLPSDAPEPEDDSVVVRLDPGLAFGSGRHPTTRMCVEFLALHIKPGMRVVDFGCGSGVLSIVAAALGATQVDAFDIDPQAIQATRENARRNGVESSVVTHEAGTSPGPQMADCAHILIANILATPLVELAPLFSRMVPRGGQIALAGLLEDQVQMVAGAYSGSFSIRTGAALGNLVPARWCSPVSFTIGEAFRYTKRCIEELNG